MVPVLDRVPIDGLPGADLVSRGLVDLAQDTESRFSLLLSIAGPRLRGLNLDIPKLSGSGSFEHRLYALLEHEEGPAAYSQYNSLLRRIVSFARALTQAEKNAGKLSSIDNC